MSNVTKKKHFAVAALLLATAACSTKPCRCYLLESCGSVRVTQTHIDEGTPCRELGYDKPHPRDSSLRYCTDWDTSEIDYHDIINMFWGE